MIHLPHDHDHVTGQILEAMPSVEECEKVAEVFKLMSDGTRLRIVLLLCHCEECVNNIAAAVEMSEPAVSHHLRVLKKSDLITSRREGKEVYYKIADTSTAKLVHQVCEQMLQITCPAEVCR